MIKTFITNKIIAYKPIELVLLLMLRNKLDNFIATYYTTDNLKCHYMILSSPDYGKTIIIMT